MSCCCAARSTEPTPTTSTRARRDSATPNWSVGRWTGCCSTSPAGRRTNRHRRLSPDRARAAPGGRALRAPRPGDRAAGTGPATAVERTAPYSDGREGRTAVSGRGSGAGTAEQSGKLLSPRCRRITPRETPCRRDTRPGTRPESGPCTCARDQITAFLFIPRYGRATEFCVPVGWPSASPSSSLVAPAGWLGGNDAGAYVRRAPTCSRT